VLAMFRFNDVQNDRNSVFIIVPNQSLVSVCCISPYNSVALETTFSWLMVRNYYPSSWLQS
jgi:hypothetical protein